MRGIFLLEHLWFVVLLVVFYRSVTTVAARTSRASVVAAWTSVVTTWSASVVAAVVAWSAVSAWLALRLDISLRLLEECLAGESHLAGLLVDLEELHVNLVADMEDILYLLGLLPSNL